MFGNQSHSRTELQTMLKAIVNHSNIIPKKNERNVQFTDIKEKEGVEGYDHLNLADLWHFKKYFYSIGIFIQDIVMLFKICIFLTDFKK